MKDSARCGLILFFVGICLSAIACSESARGSTGWTLRAPRDAGQAPRDSGSDVDTARVDSQADSCTTVVGSAEVGGPEGEVRECPEVPQIDEAFLDEPCRSGERVCVDGRMRECRCKEWSETGASCCGLEVPEIRIFVQGLSFLDVKVEDGSRYDTACTATGEAGINLQMTLLNEGNVGTNVECNAGRVWPIESTTGPIDPSIVDRRSSETYDIDFHKERLPRNTPAILGDQIEIDKGICPFVMWVECVGIKKEPGDVAEPDVYRTEVFDFPQPDPPPHNKVWFRITDWDW